MNWKKYPFASACPYGQALANGFSGSLETRWVYRIGAQPLAGGELMNNELEEVPKKDLFSHFSP